MERYILGVITQTDKLGIAIAQYQRPRICEGETDIYSDQNNGNDRRVDLNDR